MNWLEEVVGKVVVAEAVGADGAARADRPLRAAGAAGADGIYVTIGELEEIG